MSILDTIKELCAALTTPATRPGPEHVNVLREHLLAITGNHTKALCLNQLIYLHRQGKKWLTLSGARLKELAMLTCSPKTATRYLTALVDEGLLIRQEPGKTYLRAYSYQVNTKELLRRMYDLGLADADLLQQAHEMGLLDADQLSHALDKMTHAEVKKSHAEVKKSHQNKSTEFKNETTACSAVKEAVKKATPSEAPDMMPAATVAADHPETRAQALNALATVPGFAINRAQELVKTHSLEEIEQQIAALPYRKAKDPARLLYTALKRRWALPAEYSEVLKSPPDQSPVIDSEAIADTLLKAAALVTTEGKRLIIKHVNRAAEAVRVLLDGSDLEYVIPFAKATQLEILPVSPQGC